MRLTVLLLFTSAIFGCNTQSSAPNAHESTLQQGHPMNGDHTHGTGHHEVHTMTSDHAHGAGHHEGHTATRRKLDVQAEGARPGVETTVRMSIPAEDGQLIKDFKESHEAMVHLVVVREGLEQFAHLHPNVNAQSGELTVQHTFEVGGTYFFFADFHQASGMAGLATGKLTVAGDGASSLTLIPNVPGTVTGDGLMAQITIDGIRAGEEGSISLVLSTLDGKPISDLEPYMGAMGHLNAISADVTQYVHAHPSDKAGEKNRVTFIANFEKPGLYKGWGQFKRSGQVQIVPFVVKVE